MTSMKDKLWVHMAMEFYNKDYDTAEHMGVENYFNKAAAKMIDAVAEKTENQDTIKYLKEQSDVARNTTRQ